MVDFRRLQHDKESEGKNKGAINKRAMRKFNQTIDALQLLELDLIGKKFTWSNEQDDPTMSRIERLMATTEWHDLYPSANLQAICTMTSDHCPLLMQGHSSCNFYRGFRFESFWVNIDGFKEVVQQAWTPTVNSSDSILLLHVKMVRTTIALKAWRRRTVGNIKVQLAIIQIVLTMLEKAQENRRLYSDERDFRRRLKIKILGLACIQISNARQHSRRTWGAVG
jgi:hypothetical protein